MKIGLTYDLRSEYLALGYSEEETAECDREETIVAIESALQELGYVTERIGNIFSLVTALNGGRRWDLVFNIAEGMHGLSREAQVPALLEAYRIPCTFSDALVCTVTHHKPMAKALVRQAGVPTPDCHEMTTPEDCRSCTIPFPLFVKPVAEGTSKGIDGRSLVRSMEEFTAITAELIERYRQPVMAESYLPGREVTVGVVGTGDQARVAGVLEIRTKDRADNAIYSYRAKEQCEELVDYVVVNDSFADRASEVALVAWKTLGCRDAGRIDFRADAEGTPCFIEVNPLAGLHPTHSDLPMLWQFQGLRYTELIRNIVDSAKQRIPVAAM